MKRKGTAGLESLACLDQVFLIRALQRSTSSAHVHIAPNGFKSLILVVDFTEQLSTQMGWMVGKEELWEEKSARHPVTLRTTVGVAMVRASLVYRRNADSKDFSTAIGGCQEYAQNSTWFRAASGVKCRKTPADAVLQMVNLLILPH
ncbi:uncharacterized protein UV8b_00111 [Ustilaginoidea virens]|uniref:Uncharacterized protein n=1 Tax=Ustilaginoidea virens TaxID=1159556 RepID=A0A8E5HIF7_USTVR|nr:uncharacterized protein UV8b_00111 [Ustilaginoidea virens]QUC15870.1 hypothetical protein UV8b_00111 [Ustilaginoidea virens]